MHIAFVAPECDPIVKVGGLADVVGSLPRALQQLGHRVEVYLPLLGSISQERVAGAKDDGAVDVVQPPLPSRAEIRTVVSRGVPVHLVDCPDLFVREPAPYGDYEDNPARFAFFCLAVLAAMERPGWTPDAIHLHDWPTGFLPVYRAQRHRAGALGRAGIVFTIHNIAHPGVFPAGWLPVLGLPANLGAWDQAGHLGMVSALKAGLAWSTILGTVSPTYAREIQGPALGCGMDGLLRHRSGDLVGVLNGIDTEVWDPSRTETDPARGIYAPFSASDAAGKERNRAGLRHELGLAEEPGTPLFGFVGRLDAQKGISAIFQSIPWFLERGVQLAVLGDGPDAFRNALSAIADRFPGRVGGALEFNPTLAKRIYAGSDFLLMPSKFEPCGLAQMIACRFGTIPVVSRTGGLADTIRDADETADGNGFSFPVPMTMDDGAWTPAAAHGLGQALSRAIACFADRSRFEALRRRAFASDFSWTRSAETYAQVYGEAARRERSTG